MPYKTWLPLERPKASDFQTLQDQGVNVFLTAGQRDAVLPTPTPGMRCYLVDQHDWEQFDGTLWRHEPRIQFVHAAGQGDQRADVQTARTTYSGNAGYLTITFRYAFQAGLPGGGPIITAEMEAGGNNQYGTTIMGVGPTSFQLRPFAVGTGTVVAAGTYHAIAVGPFARPLAQLLQDGWDPIAAMHDDDGVMIAQRDEAGVLRSVENSRPWYELHPREGLDGPAQMPAPARRKGARS